MAPRATLNTFGDIVIKRLLATGVSMYLKNESGISENLAVEDSVLDQENYFYPTAVVSSLIAWILKYIIGPLAGKNINSAGVNLNSSD